jgi:hypothetical protein
MKPGWHEGSQFEPAGRPEPGRSLVPLEAHAHSATPSGPGQLASAPFLAHLIATAQRAPQTRLRRRAEPDLAATVYAAGATSAGTVHPRKRWSL